MKRFDGLPAAAWSAWGRWARPRTPSRSASPPGSAATRARGGGGPTLIECKTYRYSGHSRADAATYRPAGELDIWLERDPIALHRRSLVEQGVLDDAAADRLAAEAEARIEACIERTMASAPAAVATMFRHVRATPVRS